MAKINNTDIYPIKGGGDKVGSTAIGTDWEDGGRTKNLPLGDGSQDNKFRYIEFNVTIGLRVPIGSYSMINKEINRELNIAIDEYIESDGLKVSDTELIVFLVKIKHIKKPAIIGGNPYAQSSVYLRKYLFPNMKGKGEYVSGEIKAEELEMVFEDTISKTASLKDFVAYSDELIIVGNIGEVEYLYYLNNFPSAKYPSGYPLLDDKKDYFIQLESNGVEFIYYFDAENAKGGYGYYGYENLQFDRSDLILIYKGIDGEEEVDSKYDWVPVIEEVSIRNPVWLFPPMERGEARILKLVDERGVENPKSSIWVGGYSGVNCGNSTYIRCISTNAGGPFDLVGDCYIIFNSGVSGNIVYYGGSVERPKVGEVGVLYYNTDTGNTYIWVAEKEAYESLGIAVKGTLVDESTFKDENENIIEPDGDNIYIDINEDPNNIYRWNGTLYVKLGSSNEGGKSNWGYISGNIYNQKDLYNLLNNKSNIDHTHNYSDIKDLPTIPKDISELSDINKILFSGNWKDLKDKPTIPKDISELSDINKILFSGNWKDLKDKPDLLKGDQGERGIDGTTPHIGVNGNWWLGAVDTGVKASGADMVVVYDGDIIGVRDGVNRTFSVRETYVPNTLKVYFNGVLLTKGNNSDFIEKDAGVEGNGAIINRVVSPKDKLIFEFEKKWD